MEGSEGQNTEKENPPGSCRMDNMYFSEKLKSIFSGRNMIYSQLPALLLATVKEPTFKPG